MTIGGYDGNNRLNIIEKYDTEEDLWTILDLKLPLPLSNSTCFQSGDN